MPGKWFINIAKYYHHQVQGTILVKSGFHGTHLKYSILPVEIKNNNMLGKIGDLRSFVAD